MGAFSGEMDYDGPISNLSLSFCPVEIDSVCVVGEDLGSVAWRCNEALVQCASRVVV